MQKSQENKASHQALLETDFGDGLAVLEARQISPHEIVPPQDTVQMLLGSFSKESEAKNKQIGLLLDALGMSIAQTRAGYERELQSLHQQLNITRNDYASEKASFEARLNASLKDIRGERDYLRSRVRELENSHVAIKEMLVADARPGLMARLFKR